MMESSSDLPKVILSFDFEIGWGDITNPHWERRERIGVYDRLRNVLPTILAEMDDLSIRGTFASVGGMIDDPARRNFDHLPVKARDLVLSVLKRAKSTSFDGRDLFEKVVAARVGHVIASHSFSHVPFHYEGVDAAFVREDLRQFKRALGQYGLTTDRFVFPENREGYHDVLVAEGFKRVRGAACNLFSNRLLYLSTIAIVPPPLVRETREPEGFVRHHGSMLFNDAGQKAKIPLLMRRVDMGLKSLKRRGGVFHIWAHPFNFAESDPLRIAFVSMLKRLAAERDAGQLQIGYF